MTSVSDATWTVDVYNQEGTLVESITASEDFDVTNLPTGTYTVTYSDDVNDGCPAKSTEATLTEASDLEVDVTTTPMTCGEHDAGATEGLGGAGEGAVLGELCGAGIRAPCHIVQSAIDGGGRVNPIRHGNLGTQVECDLSVAIEGTPTQ